MQAVRAAVPPGVMGRAYPLHVCATVYSRRRNGTPDLLAAGYSADGTAIAVLSYRRGAAKVLDSVLDIGPDSPLFLVGGRCDASVLNLADPSRPRSLLARAIEISFGGPDWLFLWDGHRLKNITALDNERQRSTAIYNSQVVDVDHRGPLQIVAHNHDGDRWQVPGTDFKTETYTFFRFHAPRYRAAGNLVGWWSLDDQQGTAKPQTRLDYIGLDHLPARAYQLTVVNGTRKGVGRVARARIILNGTEIVSPADFTGSPSSLSRTVTLEKMNAFQFTTWGAPGSVLYVMIEARKPSPNDQSVGRAVEAAFPHRLLRPQSATDCSRKRPSWVVFSRSQAGIPKLVAAAFHNDCGGEFAMLSYKPGDGGAGKATILDAITASELNLAGTGEVSLVDLADPAQPHSLLKRTIRASLADEEGYYFLWDGEHLRNISCLVTHPGYQQRPYSAMSNTKIVDIDHQGPLQIVGMNFPEAHPKASRPARILYILYRYHGIRYVPEWQMIFWNEFNVRWGWPHHWSRSINLYHPVTGYRLVVVNGTRKKTDRDHSATVTLNGVSVFSPAEVNDRTERTSRAVTLKKSNEIDVTAQGPPNSILYVFVEKE